MRQAEKKRKPNILVKKCFYAKKSRSIDCFSSGKKWIGLCKRRKGEIHDENDQSYCPAGKKRIYR
ncbi:hypothetical protein Sgly_2844 [Syntrophobotulus glycolicus DSM 8271]|uniref:Uncharacterized protein n=1 Tax=Syntrophobotulus glycolicus (strain DSM 8271 / FlGlyR) TaxID=645991 RepID=F0SYK2_SYNGF|nr:hypothetical protein Sgly_2844 [Syntrophobotulus glycolicus DSM 8271]